MSPKKKYMSQSPNHRRNIHITKSSPVLLTIKVVIFLLACPGFESCSCSRKISYFGISLAPYEKRELSEQNCKVHHPDWTKPSCLVSVWLWNPDRVCHFSAAPKKKNRDERRGEGWMGSEEEGKLSFVVFSQWCCCCIAVDIYWRLLDIGSLVHVFELDCANRLRMTMHWLSRLTSLWKGFFRFFNPSFFCVA